MGMIAPPASAPEHNPEQEEEVEEPPPKKKKIIEDFEGKPLISFAFFSPSEHFFTLGCHLFAEEEQQRQAEAQAVATQQTAAETAAATGSEAAETEQTQQTSHRRTSSLHLLRLLILDCFIPVPDPLSIFFRCNKVIDQRSLEGIPTEEEQPRPHRPTGTLRMFNATDLELYKECCSPQIVICLMLVCLCFLLWVGFQFACTEWVKIGVLFSLKYAKHLSSMLDSALLHLQVLLGAQPPIDLVFHNVRRLISCVSSCIRSLFCCDADQEEDREQRSPSATLHHHGM